MPVEPTSVLVPGPWTHQDVSTNGTRLHVAVAGTGPLVLLVHGFPEFWWSWHHQLAALADAGYRAVACDLRGYGASDKPPRGYDVFTPASDLAGLIRALGSAKRSSSARTAEGFSAGRRRCCTRRSSAVWWLSARRIRLRMRQAIFGELPTQLRASSYLLGFQLPWRPERELVRDDAALVADLLRRWSGPVSRTRRRRGGIARRCRSPASPTCSMEYFRWIFRSMFRPDGWRMVRAMRELVGGSDPAIARAAGHLRAAATAKGSGEYVAAPYTWRPLPAPGTFRTRRRRRCSTRVAQLAGGERAGPGRCRAARNARPRDALGRPLPRGSPAALDRADRCGPRGAIRSTCWRQPSRCSTPGAPSRRTRCSRPAGSGRRRPSVPLWRALAQLAVGATHRAAGQCPGAQGAVTERVSAREFERTGRRRALRTASMSADWPTCRMLAKAPAIAADSARYGEPGSGRRVLLLGSALETVEEAARRSTRTRLSSWGMLSLRREREDPRSRRPGPADITRSAPVAAGMPSMWSRNSAMYAVGVRRGAAVVDLASPARRSPASCSTPATWPGRVSGGPLQRRNLGSRRARDQQRGDAGSPATTRLADKVVVISPPRAAGTNLPGALAFATIVQAVVRQAPLVGLPRQSQPRVLTPPSPPRRPGRRGPPRPR